MTGSRITDGTVPWVVLHDGRLREDQKPASECRRCRAVERYEVPIEVRVWREQVTAFVAQHRQCVVKR